MNDMTPAEYAAAVGAEVRAELARQRRTQAELATALGITPATAARRLDGTSPFNLIELATVANWLDVPIRQFRVDSAAVA
jgi:transcriptional regulator with XRE-family HTH domain